MNLALSNSLFSFSACLRTRLSLIKKEKYNDDKKSLIDLIYKTSRSCISGFSTSQGLSVSICFHICIGNVVQQLIITEQTKTNPSRHILTNLVVLS